MNLRGLVAAAVAAVAAAAIALPATACKPAAPAPAAPQPAATMPPEVFAVVTVPAFDRSLASIAAYADQVQPGSGAELLASAREELGPSAFDGTKPMHVVLVTPGPDGDDPEVVVVAATLDPAATRRAKEPDTVIRFADGWAVLGESPAVVDRVFAWATTTLVAAPAPAGATGVLYAAPARARWGAELRASFDAAGAGAPAALRDAVMAIVEQTDKVEVSVALAGGDLVTELLVTPRAGTTFERLLATQTPSSFRLFERLPLEQPLGAMAGHLALGELSREVEDLAVAFIGAELAATTPELNQRLTAMVEALFDEGTGEYAGVTVMATDSVINLFGMRDAARVAVALDRAVEAIRKLPMPPGIQLDVARSTHAGVATSNASLMAGAVAAATGSWAAWDGTFTFTLTDPDGDLLRETIDRARAPAKVPPDIARALADARRRGDSFLSLFDVLPGDEYPIVIALGVRSGAAYLWARVPAAQAGMLASFRRDGDGDGDDDDDDDDD